MRLFFKSRSITSEHNSSRLVSIAFRSVKSNSKVVSALREWDLGSERKFSGSSPRETLYKNEAVASPKIPFKKFFECVFISLTFLKPEEFNLARVFSPTPQIFLTEDSA